jgi:hypothetical protein
MADLRLMQPVMVQLLPLFGFLQSAWASLEVADVTYGAD